MIGLTQARGAAMARVLAGLLLAVEAMPAAAIVPASDPAMDDPVWLAQCVKKADAEGEGTTFGWGHCMVDHREALKTAQARIAARIVKALEGKGPAGTNYPRAAASFAEAQRHWMAFVDADCGIIDDVFGYGTAQGLAGEDCVIEHYQRRNDQLRELEKSYFSS
ncbi:lysozyme inhibitor LprI family protein [Novosphingobium sp. P6W]|uniref:lysozyme inhibitor LprI family protein n=1 Tax=Novosphingobium sp. P6W TaxID=1609758 RepID=UPI0005C2C718|nr:lysozyme inhibitor LprI family protein [Novosphingobium sp. P6W]KIS30026.1 hypothetical protein TQ38_25045 [Novosphingobium sp. P6W]